MHCSILRFKIEMLKFCRYYVFYAKKISEATWNAHKSGHFLIFLFAFGSNGKDRKEKLTQLKFKQKMIQLSVIDS